ncbi:MAG: hypothetical protein ACFN4S_08940 [Prevotella conceptionensis]|nr:hypothetical protein [Prevotella conceptionensis]
MENRKEEENNRTTVTTINRNTFFQQNLPTHTIIANFATDYGLAT